MNKYELRDLLDREFSHLKLDKKFMLEITMFTINWENKTPQCQEFVNSPLIGVHTIAFSTKDEGILFSDILKVDRDQLQEKIYKCDEINKSFIISSNVTNLSLVYLMHRALREEAPDSLIINLYKIFCYKQIGSMYYNFFKFPLERDKAVSVFEALSDRYLIKKLGSWEKVFIYQAELMVVEKKKTSNKGNESNREKLLDFATLKVVSAVNDMNGRIKDLVCKIAEVLYATIADKNATLKSVSSVSNTGEEDVLMANTSGEEYNTTQYLYGIIDNRNDFIRTIGIDLVHQYIKKIEKPKLLRVLEYLTEVGVQRDTKDDYIACVMSESIEYLSRQGIVGNYVSRLGLCVKKLNGYFRTATVKTESMLRAKAILKVHVEDALGVKTRSTISTLVIGVMLYLFIRTVGRNSL